MSLLRPATARCSLLATTPGRRVRTLGSRTGEEVLRTTTATTRTHQDQCRQCRWKSSSHQTFSKRKGLYRLPTESSANLAAKVRESMRLVAQPLTIITEPVDSARDGRPLQGLVASSFNVVTMSPPGGPLVSFNLKLPSRTYAAISECGQFEVSFPWSSEVCREFLKHSSEQQEEKGRHQNTLERGQDGGASRSPDRPPAPVSPSAGLAAAERGSTAVAHESGIEQMLRLHRTFAYRCDWLSDMSITVGDHIIMIGQVKEYVLGDAVNAMHVNADNLPVNWRNSKFLQLSQPRNQAGFFEYSALVAEKVI